MRITAATYRQLGDKVFPTKPRQAEPSATAKVTTTRFGFKLGKFGLNFTAKDVEFEPQTPSQAARAFTQSDYARLQSESVDVDNTLESMSVDAKSRRSRESGGRVGVKNAIKAYMQAAESDSPGTMRYSLGVA